VKPINSADIAVRWMEPDNFAAGGLVGIISIKTRASTVSTDDSYSVLKESVLLFLC